MNAAYRQLYIFQLLISDQLVIKNDLANHFHVSTRAIQRDISQIKLFIEERQLNYQLTYSRQTGGYQFATTPDNISSLVILTLIKILLASRSLKAIEMHATIKSLLNLLPKSEQAKIQPVINNESFNYQPVHHDRPLLKAIWEISQITIHHQTIDIDYRNSLNKTETRTILPQAIIFSEYYFYVVAYSIKYQANRFFRMDRIFNYHTSSKQITRSRAERVQEGELRKVLHYMQPGKMMTIQFEFHGIIEAALDRFPTAKVIAKTANQPGVIIEAKAFDTGALMWLLSQGPNVKVLGPAELVDKIKDSLATALKSYQSESKKS